MKANAQNLFGRAEKLNVTTKQSFVGSNEYSVSFTKPLLSYGLDKSLSLGLYKRSTDYTHRSSFVEKSNGLQTTLGWGNHHLSYDWVLRDIVLHPKATEGMLREGGPHVKSAIKYQYYHDTRTQEEGGGAVDCSTEVAGLGGDVRHVRQVVGYNYTQPLTDTGITFHWLSRFGIQFPFGGSRSYISDRFFLGGISGVNAFRGFEDKGVGPRWMKNSYGGDLLYSTALHLSYPLSPLPIGNLRGHVFAQAGNLASWPSQTLT